MRIKRKYGNKKINAFGLSFDSKKEYKRYLELLNLQRAGMIEKLIFKPEKFKILKANKNHKGKSYQADFSYYEKGFKIYEDVKSAYIAKTELWKLKEMLIKDYCFERGFKFKVVL